MVFEGVATGVLPATAQLVGDVRLVGQAGPRFLSNRHPQGCSVAAIAQQMRRSETAVGGLLRRGMNKLRELLQTGQPP